jgi:mono/diheme cytochrome c family protein
MLNCKAKEKVKSKKAKGRPLCAAPVGRALLVFFLFPFSFFLGGCRRDMQDQPKTIAYRQSTFYKDGTGSRPLVDGTVPRGYLREDRAFFFGKKLKASDLNKEQQYQTQNPQQTGSSPAAFADDVDTIPMPITKADLDRGQDRFNIYCSVCHGMTGYGDGIVARRGFNKPSPASYHQERLQNAPVGHFFDVMTNGWGAMPSYASQVSIEDRWRIAAYIRALQLSQMKAGASASPQTSPSPNTAEGNQHK